MSESTYPTPDLLIDTGPQGCGELLITLARQVQSMVPGSVVEVASHDPGAREDIPAWCRMRGHQLLATEPRGDGVVHFYIQVGPAAVCDGGDLDCGSGLLLIIRKAMEPLEPG